MRIGTATFASATAVALLAFACSSTLQANEYDRTCAASTDCVTVFVGDICDCACDAVGAVSKTGEAQYGRDRGEISCSNQCKPCANRHEAVCVAGQCEARTCPGSVVFCTTACGLSPTVTACACPVGMVDTATCATSARDAGTD